MAIEEVPHGHRESGGDDLGIVGLEVRQYKNLRDIWLPWSDGLALFGINGAGKTNLLECLALLMGSDQTIDLARPRLAQSWDGPHPTPLRHGSALSRTNLLCP